MSSYRMQTVRVYEHERGIGWFAQLLCDDRVIGTITQEGRGGADRVSILNVADLSPWMRHCERMGGEEQATYALLLAEESIP